MYFFPRSDIGEDVGVVYSGPTTQDLELLLQDKQILGLALALLFPVNSNSHDVHLEENNVVLKELVSETKVFKQIFYKCFNTDKL